MSMLAKTSNRLRLDWRSRRWPAPWPSDGSISFHDLNLSHR